MRLLTLSKLLAVGATAAYAYKHRHRFMTVNAPAHPAHEDASEDAQVMAEDLIPDLGDPVQGFDEVADLHVTDLDIDALDAADAEAAQDLATAENDHDEGALEIDTPSQTTLDAIDASLRDSGFADPDLSEDSEDGENWVEALETSAVEYGPEPEHDVDPTADQDERDMRDRPVADHGSGGPRGV